MNDKLNKVPTNQDSPEKNQKEVGLANKTRENIKYAGSNELDYHEKKYGEVINKAEIDAENNKTGIFNEFKKINLELIIEMITYVYIDDLCKYIDELKDAALEKIKNEDVKGTMFKEIFNNGQSNLIDKDFENDILDIIINDNKKLDILLNSIELNDHNINLLLKFHDNEAIIKRFIKEFLISDICGIADNKDVLNIYSKNEYALKYMMMTIEKNSFKNIGLIHKLFKLNEANDNEEFDNFLLNCLKSEDGNTVVSGLYGLTGRSSKIVEESLIKYAKKQLKEDFDADIYYYLPRALSQLNKSEELTSLGVDMLDLGVNEVDIINMFPNNYVLSDKEAKEVLNISVSTFEWDLNTLEKYLNLLSKSTYFTNLDLEFFTKLEKDIVERLDKKDQIEKLKLINEYIKKYQKALKEELNK